MQISYLINQYPKVSHSFVRREIQALERQGFNVQRIAQRGWADSVVDKEDIKEKSKTLYVVQNGPFSLLFSGVKVLLTSPVLFFKTLKLAFTLTKNSNFSLPRHIIYFLEACKIKSWLVKHNSQHLHAHFGTNSAEIAMLASQLSGVPYSFTVHGPEEFDKPIALALNLKIQYAKFVVAISSFGRSQLFRWADYQDWQKIKVVHCGLESNFYDVPSARLPKSFSMVCIGRLCEQKGQLLLLEAASKLHQEGVQFSLVLAGDGEMRPEVESFIGENNLQEKVTITGWISSDQVREYILASQVMILPSFAEGLPVVIMESMSLRRPVISTYVAGIPELVKHGQNGWLCEAGSINALVNTIREVSTCSEQTLKQVGNRAYDSVVARHNIDNEATKLGELFKA